MHVGAYRMPEEARGLDSTGAKLSGSWESTNSTQISETHLWAFLQETLGYS